MNQRGYSLLLSLIAVLGVGGFWVAGITIQTIAHTADQTLALSQARAALIAYAVNYIDHYGAQSAGIGHFPCPDTDDPDSTLPDTWHRDGPNPPCATKAIEHGWLPRHVNVRDGRYHFHTRSHQRLLYAVSGKFVNNPLGRTVNPSTSGEFSVGQFSDVIAVLATPPLDADLVGSRFWLSPEAMADQGVAFSLIRTTDIRNQSMQRVGGWLVDQLNDAAAQRCESVNEPSDCGFAAHSLPNCEMTTDYALLHWLNPQSDPIDCVSHEQYLQSVFTVLEEVPIKRHWFMRNKWFEFIELLFDQNCLQTVDSDCRFVLLPVADDIALIKVRLQPLPGPEQL